MGFFKDGEPVIGRAVKLGDAPDPSIRFRPPLRIPRAQIESNRVIENARTAEEETLP